MYKEILEPWLEKQLHHFRKSQRKTMSFFVVSACEIESLSPTKVGQRGTANTSTDPRNGVKRVNLLLKNPLITTEKMHEASVENFKRIIRKSKQVILAIDWTFHKDKFVICTISMSNGHKRGLPIISYSYKKGALKSCQSQNKIEEALLLKVLSAIPASKEVLITADRGFDRASLVSFLRSFGGKVSFVIRVKKDKKIFYKGKEIKIEDIPLVKGQKKNFESVLYTKTHKIPVRLVAIWDERSEEPWYLITNILDRKIKTIGNYYARRWDIECLFRTMKDNRVGFDLKKVRLQHPERWTRLLFLTTLIFHFLWEISENIEDTESVEKAFSLTRYTKKKTNRQQRIYSVYYLVILLFRCQKIKVSINSKYEISVKILIKNKTRSF